MYKAVVICDSINPTGQRLTTLELTYPRIVHSEVLTHRDRERNSASSRAIPWPKMCERVMSDPFVPITWGSEQKGMQTGGEVAPEHAALAKALWLLGRDVMVRIADMVHNIGQTYDKLIHGRESEFLYNLGFPTYEYVMIEPELCELDDEARIHKSIPNRLTEPWMWITVVMTATNWKNFFALRCHHMAEVHFQRIANMARDAMEASVPVSKGLGEWHLPYVDEKEKYENSLEDLKRCSVARCARVSYLTQDGIRDVSKDLALYERLLHPGDSPPHASPFGHVASAGLSDLRSGPFVGWFQHRKEIPNECAD